MGDDRHDNEIAGEETGPDRPAESEHGEQASSRFGAGRRIRPEEARSKTHRVEPSGYTGDRAALADQAELEQPVRDHDSADDDSQEKKSDVQIHEFRNDSPYRKVTIGPWSRSPIHRSTYADLTLQTVAR